MNYKEERVNSLAEMWALYRRVQTPDDPWIFRGQPNSKDQPKPSLERVAERFSMPFKELPEIESALLRHFKRQAHLHVASLPGDDDDIEWLALMRHYGSPTRLLDWTFSFLVALFFAVETAKEEFTVWALDYPWLREQAAKVFRTEIKDLQSKDPRWKSGEFFKRVFCRTPPFDLVYSLNPERLNQRLVIQQGVFLAPANLSKSFDDNLVALQKTDVTPDERLIKITFSNAVDLKKDILRSLFRMNINSATLFPGLEGFAESLNSLLAMPDILKGRLPNT